MLQQQMQAPAIVIVNVDFAQGYQAGKAFIDEGLEVPFLDSERIISNLRHLAQDGVFDGTQEDLMQWHVGFLVGMMAKG
jgi:hypothetical protein